VTTAENGLRALEYLGLGDEKRTSLEDNVSSSCHNQLHALELKRRQTVMAVFMFDYPHYRSQR
jgi:hypothetical protein